MRSQVLFYFFVLFIFSSCGDFFNRSYHLGGNYYLVESEGSKGYGIYFKLANGDFIGRISTRISKYCVVGDTLIIVGVSNSSKAMDYYFIDATKDHEYAEIANVVSGPFSKGYLQNKYKRGLQLQFKKPRDN